MAMRVTSSAGRPAAWQAALIRARTWASEAATWLARSCPGPCSPGSPAWPVTGGGRAPLGEGGDVEFVFLFEHHGPAPGGRRVEDPGGRGGVGPGRRNRVRVGWPGRGHGVHPAVLGDRVG